jgi:hypothetical protein
MAQKEPKSLYDFLKPNLLGVKMNEVQVLRPTNEQFAIGTQDLNWCTAMVIHGHGRAILMAHIAPLPASPGMSNVRKDWQPNTSTNFYAQWLATIKSQIQADQTLFPPVSTSCGVFSRNEEGPLHDVIAQVRSSLAGMGYPMQPTYDDVQVRGFLVPPKGELLAYFKGGKDGMRSRASNRKDPRGVGGPQADDSGLGQYINHIDVSDGLLQQNRGPVAVFSEERRLHDG